MVKAVAESVSRRTMRIERETLSERACLAEDSRGRLRDEPPCPIRTVFQRDRDRILHSNAFRRLKHKTQVFLSPEGDHYRTRLTHTLEVAQIARTIARALRLNEDLTEAIALGHDLGHTPFGHAGERALNEVCSFGFRHFEQSLRVVDKLEKHGAGLNLTYEVRDGILCHTDRQAVTLEGRVVRLSDRIAYINHDIEDAISAGVLTADDIPPDVRAVLGFTKSQRINTLVLSVIGNSGEDILLAPEIRETFDDLYRFMYSRVYTNPFCKGEEKKAEALIKTLFACFVSNPEDMPPDYKAICLAEGAERAACDYVAGMSDGYVLHVYDSLFIPKSWVERENL